MAVDITVDLSDFPSSGIFLNEQYFPDAYFRAALAVELGINEGDELSMSHIRTNYLAFNPGTVIYDPTGIEYFTALRELFFGSCGGDFSLDVSKNLALEELGSVRSDIASVNASGLTALKIFSFSDTGLESVNITGCTALEKFTCFPGRLTSLDLSDCTALTYLRCYANDLNSLDVSQNTALTYLECSSNQLTALDVSKNTALTYLECSSNQLTALDVSKNTALTYLNCSNNRLTELDLSNQNSLDLDAVSLNQSLTAQFAEKLVILADGRIGFDLGVSGIDAAQFVNLKRDGVGMDAIVSGQYLVIADNLNDCPKKVTYQFDTKYPVKTLLMDVAITIGKMLALLNNDEGAAYNNPQRIADYVGETIDVSIKGRYLSAGIWNTVCLPFGVDAADFDGYTVKELVGSNYSAETKTLTLNFADATEMVAGKPYILRRSGNGYHSVYYYNKTISDAPAAVVETEYVDFVGLYSTFGINEEDRTLLFMGGDSKLYYPNGPMKIGAFRGYFRLKNGLTAGDLSSSAKEIVLNFGDGETTSLNEELRMKSEESVGDWYSIDGRKLNGEPTAKGIYIRNGKKVIIK